MRMIMHAVSVTDGPCLHTQSLDDLLVLDVPVQHTGVDESSIRQEANPIVLIRQIRPDDVVEYVQLERVDRSRESGNDFLVMGRRQAGGVNDKTGDMIEMRV